MIQEHSETMFNDLQGVTPHIPLKKEHFRQTPKGLRDKVAKVLVHVSAECATFLFQDRYNHRAVVLETIASVPGMVGGYFQHLKSLRFIRDDNGWIRALLDEAENERMHLIIYSQVAKPDVFERVLIFVVQFFFSIIYGIMYLISPRTAHRVVGYFEEEAIHSYERYLELVHEGRHENIKATPLAISYWNLSPEARLTDMIEATIKDEMLHRDVNHRFADDKVGTQMWH
jgi:ubiquinol oxidase